jgi:hypothetical protein
MSDPERKKKAPGKIGSQGGKGRQTFPGAIGRFELSTQARGYERRDSVKRLRGGELWELAGPLVVRSVPPASMPAGSAPWSAEKAFASPDADPSNWFAVSCQCSGVTRDAHPLHS